MKSLDFSTVACWNIQFCEVTMHSTLAFRDFSDEPSALISTVTGSKINSDRGAGNTFHKNTGKMESIGALPELQRS